MRIGSHGRPRRASSIGRLLAGAATVFILAGAVATPGTSPRSAPQAVRPAVPNPPIGEACGIDVTLVLDASGSIEQYRAVEQVREAAGAFLAALANTNSRARVIDFGSNSRQTAPMTVVTSASIAQAGVHGQAVAAYYNPQPPFPPGVTGRAWRGSNYPLGSTSSYTTTTSRIYTNWDASLDQTADGPADLVVFMTDGDPNGVVDDKPGDPFYVAGDTSPDVRLGISGTTAADELSLDRAVEEANRAKTGGARMLAVGVGSAISGSTASVERLKAVTNGPSSTVVTNPAAITDLNNVDVAIVSDFAQLATALRRIVTELCSPSLTIRKLAQSPSDASYQPAPGWSIQVTPTVATGATPPYRWIQPVANAPVGPQTDVTDANGFAQFQWEPNPPTSSTTATVSETEQTDYIPRDWSCQAKNPNGTVIESSGTLAPGATSFNVTVGPEQIVTCTIRNDFDYQPSAEITKVNDPTIIRGDGNGSLVTSHYTATNTGNTPLAPVSAVDDQCSPVVPIEDAGVIVGDDGNRIVDPGETWELECTRRIQHALTDEDINIDNTVTMTGRAPNGEVLTGAATDDVDVLTPNIIVLKSVDPNVGESPLDVSYRFEVHTDGNTPIGDVELSDDTPPCDDPDNVDGPTGDTANAGFLDPGETWVYTCDASNLTTSVVNVVTVTGQPVTPGDLDPIGDTVEDFDDASVDVFSPDLQLTKDVDRRLGFVGTDFTYTYALTNPPTATPDLELPAGVTRDDAVTDDTCDDVTYVSGDDGDDSILGVGETWLFECTRDFANPGEKDNVAVATMVVPATGTELTASAREVVFILDPAIHIEKRASENLVPSGTEITYTYDVTNPSLVPIADVEVTDGGPAACSPLTFEGGDEDGDDRLDPTELWTYTCTATLTKDEPTGGPTDFDNTATVTGTAIIGSLEGPEVTDDDAATVAVVLPQIELVKSATPTETRPGGTATWTAVATNTGDGPLFAVTLSDDNCQPMEYQSGDDGDDDVMDVGEAWTYTCSGDVSEDVTNTASVVAGDQFGGEVTDDAQATVTVFTADITLTKSVSNDLVLAGTTVTYTFEVTNDGTDQLHDIDLADSQCSPTGPTGDIGGDGLLDPGEIWTYTCDQAIGDLTVNVALVTGRDHLDGLVVDVDYATVDAFETGIDIVKTASPTVLVGSGEVVYEYVVTNTGDVPLSDVKDRVVDDTCPDVEYVEGDGDENELLTGEADIFETGPPEAWLFRCTTTISEDTTNTVVVTGTPVRPSIEENEVIAPDVDATDEAFVEVLDPATITIVKRVTGESNATFPFDGDLGDFELTTVDGTASQTFDGLGPGTYEVIESDPPTDWGLVDLTCDAQAVTITGAAVSIELAEGQVVTCTFVNEFVEPPKTSMVDVVLGLPGDIGRAGPIGMGIAGAVLAAFAGLLAAGVFLVVQQRRRRDEARLAVASDAGEAEEAR